MKQFIFVTFLVYSIQLFGAEPDKTDHVNVQLVSEVSLVDPGVPFFIGVYFKLEDHWHLYWKNPGDAGLQPEFEWHLPEGFSIGEIQWPYPEKIIDDGLASYGYHNEVLLMAEVIPSLDITNGTEADIRLHAKWLICKEVCIPGKADLNISLPVWSGLKKSNDKWLQKFSEVREKLPILDSDWQISASIADTLLLLNLKNPDLSQLPMLDNLIFFPEQEDIIENAADQILLKTDSGYKLGIPMNQMRMSDPDSISGVLVSQAGWSSANLKKALRINVAISKLKR